MRYPTTILTLILLAPSLATAGSLARRTMDRHEDTIVVPGKVLGPKILGAHKSLIRVYSCRGGAMIPIQFQLDEKSPEGAYCYDRGPKDRRRVDKDKGRIDGNDELLFLLRDAGDRAHPQAMGMVPGHSAAQEIELTDPVKKGKAWVYVFRFERKGGLLPGRLHTDMANLKIRRHSEEEGTYWWTGENFRFNNDRSRLNAVRATWAGMSDPKTRTFENTQNMLDSTQVRLEASFMWVTVVRHSPEFKVMVGGYIDGPLRVVAENRPQVYLGLGMWVKAPDSYLMLWRNKMSMPTNADCPVNLDTSDDSSYTLCVDLTKEVRGWSFYNSHNAKPVAIDGRVSAEERRLDITFPEWNAIYHPEKGAMISKFVIPKFLAKRKTSKLVYVDDEYRRWKDDTEGIEFEPGAIGYSGFFMDMTGLKKGVYPGDYVVWYARGPFEPGDEQKFIVEYDQPVEVAATAPVVKTSEAKNSK